MEKTIILADNRKISIFLFIFPEFIICVVNEEQQIYLSTGGFAFQGMEENEDELDEYSILKLGLTYERESSDFEKDFALPSYDFLSSGSWYQSSDDSCEDKEHILSSQEHILCQENPYIDDESPEINPSTSTEANNVNQQPEDKPYEGQMSRDECFTETETFEEPNSEYCQQEFEIRNNLITYGEEMDHLQWNQLSQDILFMSPYNIINDEFQEQEHCFGRLCCCGQTDTWGSSYCSCGLLKWYCNRHRFYSDSLPNRMGGYFTNVAFSSNGQLTYSNESYAEHNTDSEDMSIWGSSYCSCGLLKWCCEIHRLSEQRK